MLDRVELGSVATTRIVVMGVAGSGKTTVGRRVAERFDIAYIDADSVHPPANVAKMSAGIPLTDDDRRPWLERLRSELEVRDRIVVSCSALKRSYRDVLRAAGGVVFVHLTLTPGEVARRVASRVGHFMGVEMVESQFAALEPPTADESDVIDVDAAADLDEVIGRVMLALGRVVPRMPTSPPES